MKPGDLVRINFPESARILPSYYYHGYMGLILSITKHETQSSLKHVAIVLVDGVKRIFFGEYLEVIDGTQ